MATVGDLLAKKDSHVHRISPTATVLEATQVMNHHKIGALVVTVQGDDGERAVGMFTERDVLTRIVAAQRDPSTTLVEEVMSADIAYCTPEMEVDEVGAIMRERRVRHIPVCVSHGHLIGLISIGDINAFHADGQAAAIHYLNEYIHGRV
ncbi:MAG TPA: CBS domain-containing protein [Phycisphaerae bacterium]|nr:CBS domain-containing protein [Phycisphaerae bacterium]